MRTNDADPRQFARDIAEFCREEGLEPEVAEMIIRAMADGIMRAMEDVALKNWEFVRKFGIKPPSLFTGRESAPD